MKCTVQVYTLKIEKYFVFNFVVNLIFLTSSSKYIRVSLTWLSCCQFFQSAVILNSTVYTMVDKSSALFLSCGDFCVICASLLLIASTFRTSSSHRSGQSLRIVLEFEENSINICQKTSIKAQKMDILCRNKLLHEWNEDRMKSVKSLCGHEATFMANHLLVKNAFTYSLWRSFCMFKSCQSSLLFSLANSMTIPNNATRAG